MKIAIKRSSNRFLKSKRLKMSDDFMTTAWRPPDDRRKVLIHDFYNTVCVHRVQKCVCKSADVLNQ